MPNPKDWIAAAAKDELLSKGTYLARRIIAYHRDQVGQLTHILAEAEALLKLHDVSCPPANAGEGR